MSKPLFTVTCTTCETGLGVRDASAIGRILACPKCKKPVEQEGETIKCTNPDCGLVYPIRDGIPVMLIEEAERP